MSPVTACLVAALMVVSSTYVHTQGVTAVQGASSRPGVTSPTPLHDPAATTGTARIRGRVFSADSGEPLRKAQVRASSPQLREARVTTTDATGLYELKDLPAGRYTLTAAKGSYVSLAHGQLRPFEPGRPLEISDGQTIEKVDFSLPRGSIITGVILDEFGEPATDVQVMPMRFQYVWGRRRLASGGRASMTNDIGEYRLFGLPPGQYYVSATPRGTSINAGDSDDRSGYAPTYYPGTAILGEAEPLTLGLGQTIGNVSIALSLTRTARITGMAIDSEGKPLTGGFVNAVQSSGPTVMTSGGGASIRPDGSFVLSNIVPGEYTLQATIPGSFGQVSESVTARVTVSGEDVDGVRLIGVKPSTATGRIVIDSAQARALRRSTLRLAAIPAQVDGVLGGGGSGTVNDDFTFELKARPGPQLIRLANPPFGWGLRAVRVNGVDVTDDGIEFRPNEEISGIEIELTNHLSEVSGHVIDARGRPLTDYSVIIFARDPQRWGWMSRYGMLARPDQNGRFAARALPAGDYYAIALEYVDSGEASDPEFLERIRDSAAMFTLNDGQTMTLDLRLTVIP